MKKPAILIIYTGGTIGMVSKTVGSSLEPFDFNEISRHVPELKKFGYQLSAISFAEPIDSSNINPQNWIQIARLISENYRNYDGFVVLHGTDTMAYTASALSFLLENLGKPVIFTGSQLPVSALRTDARENLVSSVEIAASGNQTGQMVPEVCIYFEFNLFRGNRTTKQNTEDFNAFHSPNYPVLAKSGVHIKFNQEAVLTLDPESALKIHEHLDTRIAILKVFPGITPPVAEAVLKAQGIRAVILESFGAGNIPTEKWLTDMFRETTSRGIIVLNVTQCAQGFVEMGRYETSEQLIDAGVIGGQDITTEAAVAKLMFLLGKNLTLNEIKLCLNKSLSGEITLT